MSAYLRMLWQHEAIRARPGLYLGAPDDRAGQAHALVQGALTRLGTAFSHPGSAAPRVRIWRGLAFELLGACGALPLDDDPRREIQAVVQLMTHMEPDLADISERWRPLVGFGPILTALSERVLIVGERRGARWSCRFSRGGLLDQHADPAPSGAARTHVVFELDPLLFDEQSRARAADPDALRRALPWHVSAHPGSPAELLWDPWSLEATPDASS